MAWFGTGETRLRSLVSKDRSYKPMVKSSGAQRESGGLVVPGGGGGQLPSGKGPGFGHASGTGARQGMAGAARPNSPGRPSPAVLLDSKPASGPVSFGNVRRLQRRLWAAAKQSEGRRFHALY